MPVNSHVKLKRVRSVHLVHFKEKVKIKAPCSLRKAESYWHNWNLSECLNIGSWLPIQHDAGCPRIDVVFFVANRALRIKRKFNYVRHLPLQNLFEHF